MRFVGIDVGAETIKLVELVRRDDRLELSRRILLEHHKEPGAVLLTALRELSWDGVAGAAVVGRLSRLTSLARIPEKQAQARAARHHYGDHPLTLISIGSHGFSVLELRGSGLEVLRENSRCSQGTGNFLRQLVGRFDLDIERASALCESIDDPAPLSGRCPVILKTDMTHLANKGTSRERILAGLYDAVCENVQVLVKPRVSPERVALIGGVTRSRRIRENFRAFLARHEMELLLTPEDEVQFFEALGCALIAAERPEAVPQLGRVLRNGSDVQLDRVAALSTYLPRVRRLPATATVPMAPGSGVVLGFDIGSTGSKVVALDHDTGAAVWEGYVNTNGDPIGAAQTLMQKYVEGPVGGAPVLSFGATGSGREIVGSLLATCYGVERVYVLNEIAAHAEGALHFEPRVDTIFEIGGQDAKYIRLAGGRVVDAAMNEACSAGTGSFIEEQGKKFSGVDDVVQLGEQALCAGDGVSLGQHCSVFMAEIIDEAVAAGIDNRSVIAGIYHSIVQNYLNRVKGSRSVGEVIFCQGMPFASDALACAVAKQTGSQVIIPPNPGTVGALGIALLTRKAVLTGGLPAAEPARFLEASVTRKDTFVCRSAHGCGGGGNRCRIDRLQTLVQSRRQRFTWGGGCSLWDQGTGRQKLPDRAPDPFREREALIGAVLGRCSGPTGGPRVAITDEFQLKGLFPFFATLLHELGFELAFRKSAGQLTLKRGIEEANVPFCAPMQQYHGLVSAMAEERPDFIFAPMLRETPRVGCERSSVVCPIVQGSPDVLRLDLGAGTAARLVSPVIDFGPDGFDSAQLAEGMRRLAVEMGAPMQRFDAAVGAAREAQARFDAECQAIGRRTLSFCREHDLVAVVVLGRPYTLYSPVLNSNVPTLLREQGAMALPIDCYPVDAAVPSLDGMYWGHGQRNLRAAHQIRRTPRTYGLWCSNYACGPDSFNLHFFAHAMEGKPFAVIETDGHSGDAGTKTRIEAFLHCVRQDLVGDAEARRPSELKAVDRSYHDLEQIRARKELILLPRMGDNVEVLAACLRGSGVRAEALPMPDRGTLELGRRHTSGKECLPMCVTLGSLLQRIERERDPNERFAFFMPTADGPCRFGVYHMLHQLVLERVGLRDRVSVWAPNDSDYFAGLPAGFSALLMSGFAAYDTLLEGLYDARPVERAPGDALRIFRRHEAALLALLEQTPGRALTTGNALLQSATGRLFGCSELLARAGRELAAIKTSRRVPTVMLVGEIYVRSDAFCNDFVIDKLEARGLRVRFAPFTEWLEYTDYMSLRQGTKRGFGAQLSSMVQRRIQDRAFAALGKPLGWRARTSVKDAIEAADGYLREALVGEAILTLGAPLHEFRQGQIDGVLNVGPLECMPSKLAEAQLFHVAEREGLVSLTLPLNGDPIDPAVIDNFVFEVKARSRERLARRAPRTAAPESTLNAPS